MPCIRFDLDGTLVDSETLGSRALLDLLPQLGAPASELSVRYRGMKMAAILADIEHALRVTGLRPYMGRAIFSAYEVGSWKPDPGLFLHAAAAMGFTPSQCIVVQDSEVGLAAAQAAGMRAIHYVGDAHTTAAARHPAVTHHADLIDAIAALD